MVSRRGDPGDGLSSGPRHRRVAAPVAELLLRYVPTAFVVRVRDDGRGLDAAPLAAGGVPGHWGLQGMRERARQLGGELTIDSDDRGTTVTLRVQGSLAYRRPG